MLGLDLKCHHYALRMSIYLHQSLAFEGIIEKQMFTKFKKREERKREDKK